MLTCSEFAAEEGKVILHQLGCISCKAEPDQMSGLNSYHQDIFGENLSVGGGFVPSLSCWYRPWPSNQYETHGTYAVWLCMPWQAALWGLCWTETVLEGQIKLTAFIAC